MRMTVALALLLIFTATPATAGTCTFSEMERMRNELQFNDEQLDRICGMGDAGYGGGNLQQCRDEISLLQQEIIGLIGLHPLERIRNEVPSRAVRWVEMPLPTNAAECFEILPEIRKRAAWARSAIGRLQ